MGLTYPSENFDVPMHPSEIGTERIPRRREFKRRIIADLAQIYSQQLTDDATAKTESTTELFEIHSADPTIIPAEIPSVNQPTGTESSQEEIKRIFELASPLAVAALSLSLLGLAPPSESIKPDHIFPYNAFFVFAWQSIATSIFLIIYFLIKGTSIKNFAWFHKRLMIIATASFLIAVLLWLFLKLSLINMLYDGLCFIAIGIVIMLYLWYSWRMANNSNKTAESSEILPVVSDL